MFHEQMTWMAMDPQTQKNGVTLWEVRLFATVPRANSTAHTYEHKTHASSSYS